MAWPHLKSSDRYVRYAARVAIESTRAALEAHPGVTEARFWLFSPGALEAFERAAAAAA